MFTGIIEVTSNIIASETEADLLRLSIARPKGWNLAVGQSIAVAGVCLTVESFDEKQFSVVLMGETIKKSIFGADSLPSAVNLERAMSADGRFEGHVVQGHVDGTGTVANIAQADGWCTITFSYDQAQSDLIVSKGSIAVSGVSLTVVDPVPGQFSVALIPHTLEVTTLGALHVGDMVNLEFDILGKYLLQR